MPEIAQLLLNTLRPRGPADGSCFTRNGASGHALAVPSHRWVHAPPCRPPAIGPAHD